MKTAELLALRVGDYMKKDLISVMEDDTMKKVDELMKTHRINHVPVVDEHNNLKGMLTKNDVQLLKDWATKLDLDSAKKSNIQLFNTQLASERMTTKLVSVGSDDTLEVCANLFRENSFHALPVVHGDKLVGIITTYDMICIAYDRSLISKK